jgi:phage recombination protein Bet
MTLAPEQRMTNGTTTTTDAARDEAKQHFERLLDRPFQTRPPHEELASQLGIPASQICGLLRQSVMPPNTSEADFLAFLHVAAKYRLNPLLREIYPMPKKGGGIQAIVSIDGWCSIVQREKRFDGVQFRYVADDEGHLEMVFCTMYVKGQTHPVEVAERLAECQKNTDPWKQMPYRMLRHRAYIQAARLAFGVHGIMDEEEGVVASGYTSVAEALAANPAKPRKENPFKAGAPTAPLATAAAEPTGGDSHPQAAPTPPAQPAPAPPPTEPKRRGRAAPQQVTTPAAAIAEQPAPPSSTEIDDDPRTNFERAEDFANEMTPAELRGYLMKLPQPKRNAAMAMAEVQSIMEKMCTDEQLRQVACNAKCAELDGR